ncbi:MAG: hypothetical protein ACPL09_06000 [Candidatus Methanodesulfokora sp.]
MRLSVSLYFFFTLLLIPAVLVSCEVTHKVELSVDSNIHSPGDIVVIKAKPACNIYLFHGNWSIQLLNGSYDEKELRINTSGFPLGVYRVVNRCGNESAEVNFTLDELIINACSPAPNKLRIEVLSKLLGRPVNATVHVNGSRYNGTFDIKPGIFRIHANLSGISAEKEVHVPNISLRSYYAPWDEVKIEISSTERPNITVFTPINVSFSPNLSRLNSTWVALFRLPQPIALGRYRVHVRLGEIEVMRNFTVTTDEIEVKGRQEGPRWILNISAFDVLTKAPVNGTIYVNGKSMRINGTVSCEAGAELRIHLIDSRGIEVNKTVKLDLVFSEKKVYAVNEEVRIWSTGDVLLMGPEVKKELNKSRYNETFFISLYRPEKAGNYTLTSGNSSYSFLVIPAVNWSFNGSVLTIESPMRGNLTLITCNTSLKIPFNGSISIRASAPILFSLGNFTGRVAGVFLSRSLYFPGDRVDFCALGNISVLSPAGRLLFKGNISKPENVSLWLNQTVELGNYTIEFDKGRREFTVDSYRIEARAVGRRIEGNVSYYFVMPKLISYKINEKNGTVPVVNGSFELNATDAGTYFLRCGNSKLNLTRDLYVESGFVNRTVRIKTSFIPVEPYVRMGNLSYRLNFTCNGLCSAEFIPRKAGVYTISVDGIKRNFTVDSCEIRASLNGTTVRGNVSCYFASPSSVQYFLLPSNLSGRVDVDNESFSFELPDDVERVTIRCGNAEVELRRGAEESVLVENTTLKISIDKGYFEGLSTDKDRIRMKISGIKPGDKVKVKIEFPFEIPQNVYVYYWKIIGNRTLPINYTIVEKRKIEFFLQDGVLDEDNKTNGIIYTSRSLKLMLTYPEERVE